MSLLQSILILLVAFTIALVFIILLIRLGFRILFAFAKRHYGKLKNLKFKKQKPKKKFTPPTDEKMGFAKNAQKEQGLAIMEQELEPELVGDDGKIVGVIKPVGKWTSLILGQKMGYLLSYAKLMNEKNGGDKGFWVNMIEAQEHAPGIKKGREI